MLAMTTPAAARRTAREDRLRSARRSPSSRRSNSGRPSLSITELCAELDTPRPTLHRILKQLEVRGFVRQLPSRRYQIGLRLFELGSLVSAR